MTPADQALHDALLELADDVAPSVALAGTPSGRPDPWRRARAYRRRRRALVGRGALVVVGVLMASYALPGAGLLSRPVEPAARVVGPGSLPDRIFPTRTVLLDVQQAPIDRAALVFTGATTLSGGASGNVRPIAIGADDDAYRVLPEASAWGLAPDGRTFAYTERADDVAGTVPSRLHLLTLGTGADVVQPLPDQGYAMAGTPSLLWAPDGRHVLADIDVRDGDSGIAASSGRRRIEVVDVAMQTVVWWEPDFDLVAGWYDNSTLMVQKSTGANAATGVPLGELSLVEAATGHRLRVLGTIESLRLGSFQGGWWPRLSPDRTQVATTYQPPEGASFVHQLRVADVDRAVVTYTSPVTDVAGNQTGSGTGTAPLDLHPVGWLSPSAVVVVVQHFDTPGLGMGSNTRFELQSLQVPSGRATSLISGAVEAQVNDVDVAADVLAGGNVRHASAPHQPLLDPRTLLPLLLGWVVNTWILLVLLVFVVGALLLGRRQVGRSATAGASTG